MKHKIALLSLALVGSAFALDEYLPIAPQKLEVDFGVSRESPKAGNGFAGVPVQFKYGIVDGLDVELAATYKSQEAASGLAQPELAVKYKVADGVALFANLVLPFATGDRADGYKGLGFAPGVVYGKNYGAFSAVGLVSYQLNMKDSDDFESDNTVRVYLKPGYIVNDKFTGYVGIDYGSTGDVNATKLVPGVTYTLSDAWAFEANLPYAVSASDDGVKTWGINVAAYYTLGL